MFSIKSVLSEVYYEEIALGGLEFCDRLCFSQRLGETEFNETCVKEKKGSGSWQ